MIKNISISIMIILPLMSFNALAASCKSFSYMNDQQKEVLVDSYTYGEPHDLAWTLSAMAWTESSAGLNLYRADIRGGSWGIYQSLLENVLWREYRMRITSKNPKTTIAPVWLSVYTAAKLVVNREFAAKHAIIELEFWKKRTSSFWELWASYNGGHDGSKMHRNGTPVVPSAQKYAGKITKRIKLLKTCKDSPLYGR